MTAVSVPIDPPAAAVDLARLVADHQATVWRYLRYLGADAAEADDLMQETFLAVYRSDFAHQCDRQTTRYLRTAARNQLFMLRRRQCREPSAVELDAADAVWASTVGDAGVDPYLEALAGCLEHLDGRARQAIDLHYQSKARRQDIAKQLKMKPEGVKTLLRRTREILRDCIERKLP
jgi:RNA polymerase sigma-70 factor, ECF subfamily